MGSSNESYKIHDFTSVHLYPAGNSYQADVCSEYLSCLTDKGTRGFKALSYEEYFKILEAIILPSQHDYLAWANYLKERYLVKTVHSL